MDTDARQSLLIYFVSLPLQVESVDKLLHLLIQTMTVLLMQTTAQYLAFAWEHFAVYVKFEQQQTQTEQENQRFRHSVTASNFKFSAENPFIAVVSIRTMAWSMYAPKSINLVYCILLCYHFLFALSLVPLFRLLFILIDFKRVSRLYTTQYWYLTKWVRSKQQMAHFLAPCSRTKLMMFDQTNRSSACM